MPRIERHSDAQTTGNGRKQQACGISLQKGAARRWGAEEGRRARAHQRKERRQ